MFDNGAFVDARTIKVDLTSGGAETVTFADARRASGADISVEACLAYFAP